MKQVLKQEDVIKVMDILYGKAVDGVSKVAKPITEVADEYLDRYENIEIAAKKMLDAQIKKCTVSGFLSGLGGAITLPVAVGADLSVTWYVQMRMIAGVAYIAGYDINSDEVRTMIYACLAGVSANNAIKQAGVKTSEKVAEGLIKKIPGEALTVINQKVGFRFITKFGSKGAINLGKMIPGVGGVISGGFNFAETKLVAARAYKVFIKDDLSALGDGKKYWYAVSGDDGDITHMREVARARKIRFEDEYHHGYDFHYVYATEDEFDELLEAVPSTEQYRKLGKKEGKDLEKWLKAFGMKTVQDVEYEVETDEE